MSELPHDPNATIDPSLGESNALLTAQFEAAWRNALRGGSQPSVEKYLAQAPDCDRTALNDELTRIDGEYRRRHAQAVSLVGAAVLNSVQSIPEGEAPGSGTILHTTDADQDVTPNPSGIQDTAERQPEGTIGYMAAPADPSATMDHEPPPDDATVEVPKSPSRRSVHEVVSVPGYEILGILGRGGMGVVYKAKHLKLKRTVALKMVLAGGHASEGDLARFYIEAEAVAQLQHPNIVQVFEISEQSGLPFFALEYVEGGSLSKKLDGRPQPPSEAARMVQTLAEAMGYAHLHGIIHRDLKPANILLTSDGQPKITDFGLAKRLEEDSGQTKSGTLMGTPNYMAPEQARGDTKDVGPLSDVYAMGVILYQMLTGRTPFVGTSILDTIQQVRNLEPVPPSRLQPKVPADLETICLKCLQKEPQKRYASADDLAQDLRFFLSGEPIRARPVGGVERLWRWCRRNPKVAGLSAAVLALLVTVAITSSVMAVRISFEHAQAVAAGKLAAEKARDEEVARHLAEKNEEDARLAQKAADANAKLAGQQRKLALDTLYQTVTKVEEKLRDRADMHDLRKDVLEMAMSGFDQVSRTTENAALIDRSMAIAYQRLADIYLQVGRTQDALRQFESCLSNFEKLAAAEPDNDWNRWNAALSHDKIGDVIRQTGGNLAAARDHYLKSLALREELAANPRKSEPTPLTAVQRQQALAISQAKLGSLAVLAGDPATGRDHFLKALGVSEQVLKIAEEEYQAAKKATAAAGGPPPNALQDAAKLRLQSRQSLAGSYFILADVSFRLRDATAAYDYYEKSLAIRQKLADEDPQSVRARRDVAAASAAVGDVYLQLARPERALDLYKTAHIFHESLAKKDKENAEVLAGLSTSFYRLATAKLYLKDAAGADSDYAESLRLREMLAKTDQASVTHKSGMMLAYARLGRHAESAKIAQELADKGPKDASMLFRAACGFALSADGVVHGKAPEEVTDADRELQKRYAESAIAALNQAVALGYKDVIALELDPDLLPLQAYPAYQELVAKVRAKAAPAGARRP
jgi:serine/threonine-protein kinase